jgi:hypothetical protein
VARGAGCDGNDRKAQPRGRQQAGCVVDITDSDARRRAIARQVAEAREAAYEADPHAYELEQATWARMSDFDEERLRETFVLLTDEDVAALMATEPPVRDMDGDTVDEDCLFLNATASRVGRGADATRLRTMYGARLSEAQYAEVLALDVDEREVVWRIEQEDAVAPEYVLAAVARHRQEGWTAGRLRQTFGSALTEAEWAAALRPTLVQPSSS